MNSIKKHLNRLILSEKYYKVRRIIYVLVILILIVVCVSLYLLLPKNLPKLPTIRQTTHGPVEGIEETTVLGQKYYAFRGIPYAAPPITGIDPYTGKRVDRRFKAPEPLNYNWTEPLKAHKVKYLCQVTENLSEKFRKFNFSEDCLVLNVFVPAYGAEKKTVLVYIHGAGVDGGTSADVLMGPDFFLTQDNIVVHVEYRVQMYGFLNLGFGEYTGNMGLKDQQLGLKWIYENIENFSGKKDEIMIFGGSVGGTFVHAHTLNMQSRQYFARAFSSSGAISYWNLPIQNNLDRIQKCLKTNRTGDDLAEFMKVANSSILSKCEKFDWVLSIESPNATAAFLTKTPKEIYMSDRPPVIDFMFVTASQESIQFFPLVTIWNELVFDRNWWGTTPVLPYDNFTSATYPKEYNQALNVFKKSYSLNTTTIDEIRRANIDFLSDKVIRDNILSTVMLQANANNNGTDKNQHRNTFFLKYSTHTNLNLVDTENKGKIKYTGATHSDDLCYFFYCRFVNATKLYKKHLKNKDHVYDLIMRWVKMITNFARYGDPSIEGDTPFKSCKSSDEIYCQEISNEPKTRVLTDIKEEFHYNAWRKVDAIYNNLNTGWHSFF